MSPENGRFREAQSQAKSSLRFINDLSLGRMVSNGKRLSGPLPEELPERFDPKKTWRPIDEQVRPDMDLASYEAHLVQRAFQYTGFFLLTFGSLQVAALMFCKGWLRAVAALPLIVMVPIVIAGANPNSHRDGSLYGLVVYVPYLPVMVYLAVVLGVGIFWGEGLAQDGGGASGGDVRKYTNEESLARHSYCSVFTGGDRCLDTDAHSLRVTRRGGLSLRGW